MNRMNFYICTGLAVGFFVAGVVWTDYMVNADWHQILIAEGFGLYCPDDGLFALNGSC